MTFNWISQSKTLPDINLFRHLCIATLNFFRQITTFNSKIIDLTKISRFLFRFISSTSRLPVKPARLKKWREFVVNPTATILNVLKTFLKKPNYRINCHLSSSAIVSISCTIWFCIYIAILCKSILRYMCKKLTPRGCLWW